MGSGEWEIRIVKKKIPLSTPHSILPTPHVQSPDACRHCKNPLPDAPRQFPNVTDQPYCRVQRRRVRTHSHGELPLFRLVDLLL